MKIIIGSFAVIALLFLSVNASIVNTDYGLNTKTDSVKAKDTVKTEHAAKTKENIGIGPIKELKLGPIDEKLVKEGKNIFNSKCMACHRLDMKLVGPPLRNITEQYSPVYLMNYLLNTSEMQKKEPQLKKLIKQYNGVLMPDQGLSKEQARSVLEYLRSVAKK